MERIRATDWDDFLLRRAIVTHIAYDDDSAKSYLQAIHLKHRKRALGRIYQKAMKLRHFISMTKRTQRNLLECVIAMKQRDKEHNGSDRLYYDPHYYSHLIYILKNPQKVDKN